MTAAKEKVGFRHAAHVALLLLLAAVTAPAQASIPPENRAGQKSAANAAALLSTTPQLLERQWGNGPRPQYDAPGDSFAPSSGGAAASSSLPTLPQGYHYRNVGGRIDVVRNPGHAADLPPLHLENGRLVFGHTPSVVRDAATRAAFLRQLADNPNIPSSIRPWLQRGEVPPGFQVHHRRALFDGGTDTIDNMVLQGTDIHTIIHRYYRPGGQIPSINPRPGTGNPY